MNYRTAIPRLLREVGWEVLSDEFAEIEDPDPESHTERQRELIREIDEARKEAEQKPDTKRFGLFKRSRLAQKKGWETYDPEQADSFPHDPRESSAGGDNVLFDIDAIRAELAAEQIEVRQLESTLPPIKLDLNAASESIPATPNSNRPDLKQCKSADDTKMTNNKSASNAAESTSTGESSFPSSKPTHAYEGADDEDIHMTFDTSYYVSPKHGDYHYNQFREGLSASQPPLHSAATTPAGFRSGTAVPLRGMLLEHNAWADGEEGEIHMTFE
jgi:hypothetical protein